MAPKPDLAKLPPVAQVNQCAETPLLTYPEKLKLRCEQEGILTEFVPYLLTFLPEQVERAFRYLQTLTGEIDDEQFFVGSQTERAPSVLSYSEYVGQAISERKEINAISDVNSKVIPEQKVIDVPDNIFALSSEPDLVIDNVSDVSTDEISVSEEFSKLITEREIQESDLELISQMIPERSSEIQHSPKLISVVEKSQPVPTCTTDMTLALNLEEDDQCTQTRITIPFYCQVETVNFDEWLREQQQQTNVQMSDNSKAELQVSNEINQQNESHKSIRIKLKRNRDGERFSVELLNGEDSNNPDWSDQSGQRRKWKKSHKDQHSLLAN